MLLRPFQKIECSKIRFEYNSNNLPITFIRTSKRSIPTIEKTIESLVSVGFNYPTIYEDTNNKGSFPAFVSCLRLILNKQNGWILLCEDDVIFCKSSFKIINTVSLSSNQIITLFCTAEQNTLLKFVGWNSVIGNFNGSLAYFVHTDSLKKIIDSNVFKNWTRSNRVDMAFCEACKELKIELIVPNPSLVQHIGEASTLSKSQKLDFRRMSFNFRQNF
jgi:hypothetical protein